MRAFEDALDTILMRSRAEAELARLKSDAARLLALHEVLHRQQQAGVLHCRVVRRASSHHETDLAVAGTGIGTGTGTGTGIGTGTGATGSELRLESIALTRGETSLSIPHLALPLPGVYALIGPNGSGKSTLFAMLSACHASLQVSTDEGVDVGARDVDGATEGGSPQGGSTQGGGLAAMAAPPAGVNFTSSEGIIWLPAPAPRPEGMAQPVPTLVEVSQRAYTPLHVRPIEWMSTRVREQSARRTSARGLGLGAHESAHDSALEIEIATSRSIAPLASEIEIVTSRKIALLASELRLGMGEAEGEGEGFVASLLREHEDWGSAMSGGQRIKLELIRSVFLAEICPEIVLLDEAFAPLDALSKQLVMRRLRSFCSSSLVIVIYHTEAKALDDHDEPASRTGTGTASRADVAAERTGTSWLGRMLGTTRRRQTADEVDGRAVADACEAGSGQFFDGVVQYNRGGGPVRLSACARAQASRAT
jgi:hypothetical protein